MSEYAKFDKWVEKKKANGLESDTTLFIFVVSAEHIEKYLADTDDWDYSVNTTCVFDKLCDVAPGEWPWPVRDWSGYSVLNESTGWPGEYTVTLGNVG